MDEYLSKCKQQGGKDNSGRCQVCEDLDHRRMARMVDLDPDGRSDEEIKDIRIAELEERVKELKEGWTASHAFVAKQLIPKLTEDAERELALTERIAELERELAIQKDLIEMLRALIIGMNSVVTMDCQRITDAIDRAGGGG